MKSRWQGEDVGREGGQAMVLTSDPTETGG